MNDKIRNLILSGLNESYAEAAISCEEFYFRLAREAWQRFVDFPVTQDELTYCLGMKYEDFKSNEKVAGIREVIYNLVAYCDYHASEKKERNMYPENRTIATAGIRQNYNISYNYTDYLWTVVDFATAETYSEIVDSWRELNPGWFEEKFSDYESDTQKAQVAFLVKKAEKIASESKYHADNFVTYKKKKASQKNAVAYTKLITPQDRLNMEQLEQLTTLLKAKKNLILQGAPGTGKTYSTAALALSILEEPLPDLKDIQSWILNNILEPASKTMVSPVAKAFMPKKSIRDNARFHKKQNRVVAMDVENFFGSIQYGCIYEVFRTIGYTEAVSTLLTKLCTYNNYLPQGAPTSPMLSNLVMKRIDDRLWSYCKDRKIIYTRYADDLTFSGDSIQVGHLMAYVEQALMHRYLHFNHRKTKVMGRGTRQSVTGIVVNEKVQVSRAYRDKIRQEIYYCIKYGIDSHMQQCSDKPLWIKSTSQYVRHLLGKVEFVLQINPHDKKFIQYAQWLKSY